MNNIFSVREFELFDRELLDACEQADLQDWMPLEINQLSSGEYSGRLRELRYPGFSFFSEKQNSCIRKRAVSDSQYCTVSYAHTKGPRDRFSEYSSGDHSLFFMPGGTEFDMQVGAGVDTFYYRFNQAEFLQKMRTLTPRLWEKEPDSLQLFEAQNRRPFEAFSQQLLTYVANLMPQEPSASQLCESKIIDEVALTLDAASARTIDGFPGFKARRRAVVLARKACDLVGASLEIDFCPSVVDLCRQLAVSQRTLQYSFKAAMGLTPNTYLRLVRLNRVRAELNRPTRANVTVTEVATRWHFGHLGKFSQDYSRMFGEPPSATLRRGLS